MKLSSFIFQTLTVHFISKIEAAPIPTLPSTITSRGNDNITSTGLLASSNDSVLSNSNIIEKHMGLSNINFNLNLPESIKSKVVIESTNTDHTQKIKNISILYKRSFPNPSNLSNFTIEERSNTKSCSIKFFSDPLVIFFLVSIYSYAAFMFGWLLTPFVSKFSDDLIALWYELDLSRNYSFREKFKITILHKGFYKFLGAATLAYTPGIHVFLILGAYYGVCFIIKLVQGKAIKKAREEANPPDIALDSFRRLPDGSFVRC
ncbi:hypothetical protein WICANDRAFT_80809 [Wickerhamomyces anomalus NRRL Y-366-8]|uniref:Uncharacterized protein n=1 Tax=Wickerhamomyces anomalus (strain ATCC 58044 / CBS 1984 / NCYC 433 / NRRL Y-366-8) TaxID=683960 RepID=A0A1E3NXR2_WICAA|nr:uncharacterized protein WICANDRAFT_80809 [Wickerhamomyces anomalus NRRL Y-366-8]ODQ57472.1 hypothetical protein WICANDRAFT_80809 [Wickerhamomyces anomalus NRRL Y-366-8]